MKRRNKVLYRSDDVSSARCLTSPRIGRSRRVECSRPSTTVVDSSHWCATRQNVGAQEDMVLSAPWVRWILSQAQERGIAVLGAEEEETGGWNTCSPHVLLAFTEAGSSRAWVSQRTGCSGYVTTVQFEDPTGRCGAWMVDRPLGNQEPELWRILLLEALVLSYSDDDVPEFAYAL